MQVPYKSALSLSCCLVFATAIACDSDASSNDAPDAAVVDECSDNSVQLQPAADRYVFEMASDGEHVYFSNSVLEGPGGGMYRIPVDGGNAEFIDAMSTFTGAGPLLLDGNYLYFGDEDFRRIAKDGSSAQEVLYDAVGNVGYMTQDDTAVYFVDGHIAGEDSSKTIHRFTKANMMIEPVATMEHIRSPTLDTDSLYWLGSIDPLDFDGIDNPPNHVYRTDKVTGDTTTVFAAAEDRTGPNPNLVARGSVVVHDGYIYFPSEGEDGIEHDGIYRISQDAVEGEPERLTGSVTLTQGFVAGDYIYTNMGVEIARVSLLDGSKETVACATIDQPIGSMTHDGTAIYYSRATAPGVDAPHELRKVDIPTSN